MDIIADKSERVTCPFNRAHVIERRRLQTHIIKCKRNLPHNHDFVQCQFWALHYVKKSELDTHYKTCEHALMKEASKRTTSAAPSRFKEPKLIYDESAVQSYSDESWDVPADQPMFQPEALRAKSTQMIIPHGLSKAKRRECREVERKRLRELEQTEKLAEMEKSWDLEPFSQNNSEEPGNSTNQLMIEGTSAGTGQAESVAESSASRSTSDSCGEPPRRRHHGMPPPHEIPPPHHGATQMTSHGRGRGLLSAWGDDARPSYHPYPYNGIPYRYSPNDFPGL